MNLDEAMAIIIAFGAARYGDTKTAVLVEHARSIVFAEAAAARLRYEAAEEFVK